MQTYQRLGCLTLLFIILELGAPMAGSAEPEKNLKVFCTASLARAVEPTINVFERKQGLDVDVVYNGSGILISQIKAGQVPDVLLTQEVFADLLVKQFTKPLRLAKNSIVIVVPKGNPKKIRTLRDLTQPKLRLGVGKERTTALGVRTDIILRAAKVYDAIQKNKPEQYDSSLTMILALRIDKLDAAIMYANYAAGLKKQFETISIKHRAARTNLCVAVARKPARPELAKQLLKALQSANSQQRFKAAGYEWALQPQGAGQERP